MDMAKLFQLKYDLLEKIETETFQTPEQREAFIKGYEQALNAFFVHALNEILESAPDKKKAS
jgi:DNA relaxase NicK